AQRHPAVADDGDPAAGRQQRPVDRPRAGRTVAVLRDPRPMSTRAPTAEPGFERLCSAVGALLRPSEETPPVERLLMGRLRGALARVLADGLHSVAADLRGELPALRAAAEHLGRLSSCRYVSAPEGAGALHEELRELAERAARLAEALDDLPDSKPSP